MSRLFLVAEVLFGLGLDLEAVVGFKVTVSDITGDQSNRNKGPARLRSPGQSTQEHVMNAMMAKAIERTLQQGI